jgi:hypothetical protein
MDYTRARKLYEETKKRGVSLLRSHWELAREINSLYLAGTATQEEIGMSIFTDVQPATATTYISHYNELAQYSWDVVLRKSEETNIHSRAILQELKGNASSKTAQRERGVFFRSRVNAPVVNRVNPTGIHRCVCPTCGTGHYDMRSARKAG